jgi:hypothetical protein
MSRIVARSLRAPRGSKAGTPGCKASTAMGHALEARTSRLRRRKVEARPTRLPPVDRGRSWPRRRSVVAGTDRGRSMEAQGPNLGPAGLEAWKPRAPSVEARGSKRGSRGAEPWTGRTRGMEAEGARVRWGSFESWTGRARSDDFGRSRPGGPPVESWTSRGQDDERASSRLRCGVVENSPSLGRGLGIPRGSQTPLTSPRRK